MANHTLIHRHLPNILRSIPSEWRGTTFNNSNLLGREGFSKRFVAMLEAKEKEGSEVRESDLIEVGNAEDYLRVSTNISTILELTLAMERGYDVTQVFTFSSVTMPVLSVLLVSHTPVHLYLGNSHPPFTPQQLAVTEHFGAKLIYHTESNIQSHGDEIVLAIEGEVASDAKYDGLIRSNILYLTNPHKIKPADILVIRKRTATPITTPAAEAMLHQIAALPSQYDFAPTEQKIANFYAHLQTMSGTEVNTQANPVITVAGLASIASLWVHLLREGGADILMCSTAYGGSSQLMDLLSARSPLLRKYTFHIQGTAEILSSIKDELNVLSANPHLKPITVLFVEIPTNPDMKVIDLSATVTMLDEFRNRTGKEVLLLLDTTFAPASEIMKVVKNISPHLPVIVFVSMSKSVSRGLTTAGGMIANHTEKACALLEGIREMAILLDVVAKVDQIHFLVENHIGVEQRCQRAYDIAAEVGQTLKNSVRKWRGEEMSLAFVTPEHAKMGLTTSTYSFNLPAPLGATEEDNAKLAQRFVDLLTAHSEFKPCVSFGQDNHLVYATVPATSTQGAIKEEDKAKQAVGGVQLVRLSFPPSCDVEALNRIVEDSVRTIYSK
jgi:cystathionine beta-lyase/cystathionine gamma-synthase